MPVSPLVASITVCPGFTAPVRSASSITPSASLSFTDPSGLNASTFTNRSTPAGASLLIRTTGVFPTVSRIFANFRFIASLLFICTESTQARPILLLLLQQHIRIKQIRRSVHVILHLQQKRLTRHVAVVVSSDR